ncbi:MAG: hypothetical protein LBB34_01860 [Holosporales bacterium]|jgi:hypothetical protein|nr:hypothetical protein [Holosporales bacterium]
MDISEYLKEFTDSNVPMCVRHSRKDFLTFLNFKFGTEMEPWKFKKKLHELGLKLVQDSNSVSGAWTLSFEEKKQEPQLKSPYLSFGDFTSKNANNGNDIDTDAFDKAIAELKERVENGMNNTEIPKEETQC